jgi:hypothetical protein
MKDETGNSRGVNPPEPARRHDWNLSAAHKLRMRREPRAQADAKEEGNRRRLQTGGWNLRKPKP